METCPLNVLPREQHLGLSADTMMGPGRDSLPAPHQFIPFKQPPALPPNAIRFMQGMPFPVPKFAVASHNEITAYLEAEA